MTDRDVQDIMLLKQEIENLKYTKSPIEVINFRSQQLDDKIEISINKYTQEFKVILNEFSSDILIKHWSMPRRFNDNWKTFILFIETLDKWKSVTEKAISCKKCGKKTVFQCSCGGGK